MRVEQTSPTTFELTTDNGCIALAGFSTETMGSYGVYFWRGEQITKMNAEKAFRADPRVEEAIAKLR